MKKRRGRREHGTRKQKKLLIICEGKASEVNYFRAFPAYKKGLIDVNGLGRSTVELVEKALRIKNKRNTEYSRLWCVFDKNAAPDDKFNQACKLARVNNIGLAYSNPGFELWYLLHFCDYNASLSIKQCIDSLIHWLKKEFNCSYTKDKTDMYQLLKIRQSYAILRAEKLQEEHNRYKHCLHSQRNPSTQLHKLVMELNNLIV